MAGSLSNIGLGSNGALSYDVIDKLKKVDTSNQVTPIDNKISENSTKIKDLSVISTLTASLKGATSSLAEETTYLQRKSSVTGDGVSVNVSAGTAIQDFSIDVTNLAKRDIYQSASFSDMTSTFTNAATDTININIDGKDYKIDITSSTTLSELKDKINDATDGKVQASILNVGGTTPYKLVVKSTNTGSSQAITMTSTNSSITDLGLTNIQNAKDANFTFNGVSITRDSNTFDDLIVGVEITLKQEATTNTVNITQDTENIINNLNDFVSKYNELISNLNEATKYDTKTKTAGTFQGVSQITSMKSNINRILLSVDSQGRTLEEFGLSLNESGILEFNQTTFDKKMASDADGVKDFFSGSTTYNTTIKAGSTISAGAIDLTAGDFSINGVDIIVSLNGATSNDNALALKTAINTAGITGIEAVLNSSSDGVILKSTSGKDIKITGDSTKLSSIGLQESTTRGTSTTTEGIFSSFNSMLRDLVIGDNSILTIYEQSLTNESKSLSEERQKTVDALDTKYQIMAENFMAYDAIISKLNSQFQSLSMMIQKSYNSSN
ncbi:flagellar filament capping protein FliD [Sulfurospirillum sp. 1307]